MNVEKNLNVVTSFMCEIYPKMAMVTQNSYDLMNEFMEDYGCNHADRLILIVYKERLMALRHNIGVVGGLIDYICSIKGAYDRMRMGIILKDEIEYLKGEIEALLELNKHEFEDYRCSKLQDDVSQVFGKLKNLFKQIDID